MFSGISHLSPYFTCRIFVVIMWWSLEISGNWSGVVGSVTFTYKSNNEKFIVVYLSPRSPAQYFTRRLYLKPGFIYFIYHNHRCIKENIMRVLTFTSYKDHFKVCTSLYAILHLYSIAISNCGVVLKRPNESITLSDYAMILYVAGLPSGNKETLVKITISKGTWFQHEGQGCSATWKDMGYIGDYPRSTRVVTLSYPQTIHLLRQDYYS